MSVERRPSELARLAEVRRVGGERTAEVAAVLAAAFAKDPLQAWIMEGVAAAERPARRRDWWSFMIRHGPPGSEVHVAGDGAGAACWHPPDAGKPPAAVTAAFRAMVADLAGERTEAVLASLAAMAARAPAEPHWHLAAVGVVPDRWGNGTGGRLLAPMLARCDRLGLAAYLESSNPRNLGFYCRLGFVVTGEVRTVDERVPVTLMQRPPTAGR
ncbi:MAG: GNAT family N-acetyltransferase [bacterium]|nr:GNAT family N-acetyltransferase [bacterium]MDE0669685.1 GNAT family N-acetyltransferase [bacterium]MXZ30007.1 GNAT family N-acetyltransferase [Acidimicrobiia bacterium]MYB24983.1 GNAT family N-acetyltransferase [Acidimicrobiia bacterium]MYJ13553.1 GNAT family N-acetyltransferase [Acidimicrobiia bacterium]